MPAALTLLGPRSGALWPRSGAVPTGGGTLAERLELPAGLRIGQGSAGQRRKAGLAGDPPVLPLDEPWAAIDIRAVTVVTALLELLRATRTVLFTAHGDCHFEPDRRRARASRLMRQAAG